jgi:SAM-dependent methyltransferase
VTDWRLKVLGHWLASAVPPLQYQMQRHVSHALPRGDEAFAQRVASARRHFELATEVLGRAPRNAYEFGVGWDMIIPLAMSQWIPKQTVTDVRRLARPELVADAGRRLGVGPDLAERGIDYRAPVDTSATGLAAGMFDLVHSTSVLEHVPVDQLTPLLAEGKRLLAPGGVLSALVDYSDHYSHGDRRLDPQNFLRYGERTWRLLNPPSHYQSRLRHPILLEHFAAAGLSATVVETVDGRHGPLSAWITARRGP